jgi:phage gp16-like protein
MSKTIATIHVACKQLGIEQEARHDMQLRVVGKASLKDMTPAEQLQVLEHLRSQGFKTTTPGNARRKRASRGDVRFCHVLWTKLAQAGAVDVAGAKGLNAFIRAAFGAAWGSVPLDVDQMHDHAQIATVIEALKAMCTRAGIKL